MSEPVHPTQTTIDCSEPPVTPYHFESSDEKNIALLKTVVFRLENDVRSLKTQQLAKELHLDESIIQNSEYVKPYRRTSRGRSAVPLLESEIRDAQEKTKSACAAARYLRVHYCTYKKYAKLFGIWKTNQNHRGLRKMRNPELGKYPISKLITGEFPDYPVYRLKTKLITSGIKKAECEQCGYSERRVTDQKMPLLLNFEDGNHKNHKLENMKILCYNCTFCSGRGYITKGKKYHALVDPDRAQGAQEYLPKGF